MPEDHRRGSSCAAERSAPRTAWAAPSCGNPDGMAVFLLHRPDVVADSDCRSRWYGVGVELKRSEKSAVELYEEATHLLRRAPVSVIAYYTGSVPFILAFLFFWADMSQSSLAYEHCAPASLGLALLYCLVM